MGRRKEYGGSHDLGPKVKHGEGLTSLSAAKKKWLTVCDAIMGRGAKEHPVEWGDMTFRRFVETVFVPDRKPRWRETTEYTINYYLNSKLYPEFESTILKEMTDAAMQAFLDKLVAKKYSRTVVEHCLTYLRAILEHAREEGVFVKNPARKLEVPPGVRAENRPFLSLAEYNKLLEAMPMQRDRLMVKLLYMGGLRRGELFGARWQDYDGVSLAVVRQMNRFNKEAPVKTHASVGKVSLPPDVCADLNEWRKWCGTAETENDYIFTSRRGSPIHFKNWIDRTLTPAATKAGMPRISYHMFRRGLATELHQNGAVDKNIQSQLRHADPATTRIVYMREVPEEQAKAVALLGAKAIASK
jgi:integrase